MRELTLPVLVVFACLLSCETENKSVTYTQAAPAAQPDGFVPLPMVPAETLRISGRPADLMRGSWKIISIQSDKPCDTDGDGILTCDVFSEMPTCALDDVMMIREDKTVRFKRNQRCQPTEQAVETYNWTLSDDGIFMMSVGSIEAAMRLIHVTGRRLAMEIPMEAQGEMFYFTVNYERE